jgi:hypothetical protein
MIAAGNRYSPRLIIDKIHSTEAIDFDTSVEGVTLLKASNVRCKLNKETNTMTQTTEISDKAAKIIARLVVFTMFGLVCWGFVAWFNSDDTHGRDANGNYKSIKARVLLDTVGESQKPIYGDADFNVGESMDLVIPFLMPYENSAAQNRVDKKMPDGSNGFAIYYNIRSSEGTKSYRITYAHEKVVEIHGL